MIDLGYRHDTKELMDRNDIPFADMAKTLQELDTINTRLGGHAITISGLKELLGHKKELVIAEIGCGGGDNLRVIHRYCKRRNIQVKMIGIDINPECVRYASERNTDLPASWVCSDYAAWIPEEKPDLIFSSLFCHHFTDQQLVPMLRWLSRNAGTGFFINDLHRHRLAYYLIRYITRFFSRSYLVKHDAAVSVSRGFSKENWNSLFEQAGLKAASIRWRWAFRWLVIFRN